MNERIQQLADQARQYAREYVADCKHYGHYMEHNELEVKFEEKFAELLISAVMAEVKDEVQFQCGWANAEIVENRVKKEFGV